MLGIASLSFTQGVRAGVYFLVVIGLHLPRGGELDLFAGLSGGHHGTSFLVG